MHNEASAASPSHTVPPGRMASPDRLDMGARLVSPASKLLLAAALLIVATCLTGSILIRVPIKVQAQGLLMTAQGVKDAVATSAGRVRNIRVRAGEHVRAGQTIADIEQPDLQQDIAQAQAELGDAGEQLERIQRFQTRSQAESDDMRRALRTELDGKLAATRQRQVWLRQQADATDKLVALGIAAKPQSIAAHAALDGADEELARGRNALRQLELDTHKEKIGHDREGLELALRQASARRKLAMLNERLQRLDVLTSPYSGTVAEFKLNEGEMIERGGALFSLLPDALASAGPPAGSAPLIATVYVSAAEGKNIQPGMRAELVPATVKREEYGFVFGRVLSVAAMPATQEGMQRTLKNQKLVQTLSSAGAPFEVVVALDADPATASGLRWSSSRGPATMLSPGSLCSAAVVTREETVFRLLVPAARRLLSGFSS